MKYIMQAGIICAVSFAGEVLHDLLPFSVPASVYGLVLMFLLLLTGVIRLSWVENVADYLMSVMPIFFIEPTVGLMTSFGVIRNDAAALVVAAFLSTMAVMAVTGLVSQAVIRAGKRKGDGKDV